MIDQNYVRRKFRVIYALDLMLSILLKNDYGILQSYNHIGDYVQVSGDKNDTNYLKVSGYRPARQTGFTVYFVPVTLAAFGVLILW
jgi:hypothetical protein